MQKGISWKLYKKHNGNWFAGKRAVVLHNLPTSDNAEIKAGETVIIKRKWSGFIVQSENGSCAWRVPPVALNLILAAVPIVVSICFLYIAHH